MKECVRCGAETDNDFGEDTALYIEDVQARYLCDECVVLINIYLENFLVSAPVELTPKEQELEDYFGGLEKIE